MKREGCQGWGIGGGLGENGVNGAGSSAKFVLFGFFVLFNVYFIIIIIYEFPLNRSFLLTRGMGRGGGGGAEALTPGTCRAGLGQYPLRIFLTLFNLSTKNKWCFTFLCGVRSLTG